jgi:hypothetical protein
MEIGNFVTQDLAEEGQWFSLVLYNKKTDIDICILGDDSDQVQRQTRKALKKLRSKIKPEGEVEFDDETIDGLADANDESVLVRIAGIRGWKVERKGNKEISREPEPVTLNGVELKNDRQSYELLIKKIPAIKDFVLKTSRERTNFLFEKPNS